MPRRSGQPRDVEFSGAWTIGHDHRHGTTVNLGGIFTTAGLGAFNRTLGTVNLTGTLTNTDNTLTFDATTGSWNLVGGTVEGGALVFQAGQSLLISSNANNRLTAWRSPAICCSTRPVPWCGFSNGLNINGVVHGGRRRRVAGLRGQPDVVSGHVVFEGTTAAGGHRGGQRQHDADARLGLHRPRRLGDIGGSRYLGNAFALVDNGAIAADVSSQSLDITSRVTLTNNGTLAAEAGSVAEYQR